MDKKICDDTLISFLNFPISGSDEIFDKFAALPGAVYKNGDNSNQRYLFVPGKNKNRVLLVAHTDTVWDKGFIKKDVSACINVENGNVFSGSQEAGIGADDRAGCAALWLFRNSGHSLLLIDGEENGHTGAAFIKKDKKLFAEINNHILILCLDLWEKNQYNFHHVSNPKSLKKLVESCGYKECPMSAGSDIFYLCRKAAGVNVSIGYNDEHKPSESISLSSFFECVNMAQRLIDKTDRYYKIPLPIRIYKFIRHQIALRVKPILKFTKQRRKK